MTVAMLMRQEHKAGFAEGWKDGRAEGWKDGEASERRRMALNMLDLGIPEDKILSVTGFSQEQLTEMKKGN